LDSVTNEHLVRMAETAKCQQGMLLNYGVGETATRYINKQTSCENVSVELYPNSWQLDSAKLKKSLIIFSLICCRATYPLLLCTMMEWLLV